MMRFRNPFWLVSAVLLVAGCGGSTTTGGGGATTPTVSVSASPSSITTAQGTTVTVTVSGTSGTPAGSVMLSSGSYSSGAVTLTNGSASISIAAGKLATGTDTLSASYTSTSSSYNNASGTGSVTVTGPSLLTPTVTVSASPSSITTAQSTTVTVTVSGTSGTPTGSITLTSGSYNSGAKSLVSGSVQITVQGSSLATASDTLTAAYTPDAGSSSTYNSASGTGSVTVTAPTLLTPTVTVSASPSSITTAQSTTVTVTVSGTSGTPTGSVTLTSGSYNSGAKSLVSGSVQITVQGSSLATASDTLTAAYTPDAGSSSTYNSASGTGSVTVTTPTLLTPTVTVSPNPTSITTAQSTTVTVTVSGTSGTPTGSITLTSGSYNSGAKTLVNGSVQITVQGSALATGSNVSLAAAYTPDAGSSSTYNSATGTGSVTVTSATQVTPTVTVTPNPSNIGSAQSTTVTVTVSGPNGDPTPTGSVTLNYGSTSLGSSTLTSGSAQIVVQGTSLPDGNDLLTAKYTPDAGSSSTYNNGTGITTVDVTGSLSITSFTASPNPIPAGSTSTQLTAVFAGGTGVITPGSISVTSGTPVTVSPTASSTVYTLTVTPTTGSAITQTVTVNIQSGITVNPANPGIAVTNQILGMNMAAWYDELTNATPINTAFAANGIKAIRWPGGSWSDVYHWGYQSGSGTLVTPYQCTCSSATHCTANSTGWAGYGSFANFVSAIPQAGSYDLALTADYGTNETCNGGGDPNEAAAWVTAATSDGVTVSHMTVGNEEYGSWETDLHAKPNDPGTYASAVVGTTGYYQLIKAASSSTLVGVVVDADNSSTGWDKTVLTNAKGSYDFVEYHYYPETPGAENDTTLMQNAAKALTTNINTIKTELSNWGTPGTPIYVGEIGGPYSNPGKQSWSITQGMYAGEVLGEMMNDGVSRLTWWISFGNCNGQSGNDTSSVYGWQNFGAYNVFSDGNQDSTCDYGGNAETTVGTPSPTAIAFDLFSNVAVNGEYVLTPAVTGDTTDVRAYAATHSGGTALIVFNLNETTAQTVELTVTGENNSAGVTEYTYDKEMYDYTNTSCDTAPTCTVDPNHTYSNVDWVGPTTTSLGQQTLPMTVTLQPWSMNVFIIQ